MARKESTVSQKLGKLRAARGAIALAASIASIAVAVILTISFQSAVEIQEQETVYSRVTNSSVEVHNRLDADFEKWEDDIKDFVFYLSQYSNAPDFDPAIAVSRFEGLKEDAKFGLCSEDGFHFVNGENFGVSEPFFEQLNFNVANSTYFGHLSSKPDSLYFVSMNPIPVLNAKGVFMEFAKETLEERWKTDVYHGNGTLAIFDKKGHPLISSSKNVKAELSGDLFSYVKEHTDEKDYEEFLKSITARQSSVLESFVDGVSTVGYYAPLSDKPVVSDSSVSSLLFSMFVNRSELSSQLTSVAQTGLLFLFTTLGLAIIIGVSFIAVDTRKEIVKIKDDCYDPVTGLLYVEQFREEAYCLIRDNPNKSYAVVAVNHADYRLFNHLYARSFYVRLQREIGDKALRLIDKKKECAAKYNSSTFLLFLQFENQDALLKRLHEIDGEFQNVHIGDVTSFRFTYGIKIVEMRKNLTLAYCVSRAIFALEKSGISSSKSKYTIFDKETFAEEIDAEVLEKRAPDALRAGEFEVFTQFKYDLKENKFCGAEALARWRKDKGGYLGPAIFIPLFERNGFINEFDEWVLASVCAKLRNSLSRGERVVPISINVSKEHFKDPHFISSYSSIISRYSIPHDLIEFELTESITAENIDQLKDFLAVAHRDGFLVSMDDFGSGYSSLNLIKELDFDIIKLDCRFFQGSNQEAARIIIATLIELCHKLGKKVVAEGIEDEGSVEFLRGIGCDTIQGFYFSKPAPYAENAKKLIEEGK